MIKPSPATGIVSCTTELMNIGPTLPEVQNLEVDLGQFAPLHQGRSVLITGAGGSIGSCLFQAILCHHPKVLVGLDSSESSLHDLCTSVAPQRPVTVLGSVCDAPLLEELFRSHRPEIVYHAAAFKHVAIAENNPFEVTRNNVLGTHCVAQAAMRHGTEQVLTISTDKAVDPTSILGAGKRIAELLMLAFTSSQPLMKAVRLANIWGSRGSVVPLFLRQISAGGPLTVTDPAVQRYFMSMSSALAVIFTAAAEKDGGIFVPELENQIPVLKVAQSLIQHTGLAEDAIPIVFTGLQPGEKMEELLVSKQEIRYAINDILAGLASPTVSPQEIIGLMEALGDALQRRSLPDLLNIVLTLVPEYRPSDSLTNREVCCGRARR